MTLREETFKLDTDPVPLVIVDFMVVAWMVYGFINDIRHLYSPEMLEKVIKAVWAIKLNRGPDMLPLHDYRIVVVSDKKYEDSKTYWRGVEVLKDERIEACWEEYCEGKGIEVTSIPTGYKGGRRDKDDEFYKVTQIGWDYASKYFPCFKREGFEADDWAGALYREVRDGTDDVLRKRQKLLSTVDRDWSGLVNEDMNIWWCNTRYCGQREKIQERLAGEEQVIFHTQYKMKTTISHPIEIFAAKAEQGEMGDNLPPGAPIEYIDLTEFHPKYKLENFEEWEDFQKAVGGLESNVQPEHYHKSLDALKKIGIAPLNPWLG